MAITTLHADQYPCPLCSAHFAAKEEQVEHLSRHHSFSTPWICHECPTSYTDAESLQVHISTMHPTLPAYRGHPCHDRTCGPALASEHMYIRHKKQDHVEQAGLEKRKCIRRGCDYGNESYVGISLHVLHLHAPTCDSCGKVFSKVGDLLSHKDGKRKGDGCQSKLVVEATSNSTSSSSTPDDTATTANLEGTLEASESYETADITIDSSWLQYLNTTPEPAPANETTNFGIPVSPLKSPAANLADDITSATTPLLQDAFLLPAEVLTPQLSHINARAPTSTPHQKYHQGPEYRSQQELDTTASVPTWISPQSAYHDQSAVRYVYQQPHLSPNLSWQQQPSHNMSSLAPCKSHFAMDMVPPPAPQRDYRTQHALQEHWQASETPSMHEYGYYQPQLPSQALATTIDPRMLNGEIPSTFTYDFTGQTQNENLSAAGSMTPRIPQTMQQLGLPVSIYSYGFRPEDFDPRTTYTKTLANKDKFKPFPPDLQEHHILNADPKQICYGNLLRIATKYSNSDLVRKVNEGRPEPVFKSTQVVESRIRSALGWKAEKENPVGGVDAVKDWFEKERARHGIAYRRKKRDLEDNDSVRAGPTSPMQKRIKRAPRPPIPTPSLTPERTFGHDLRAAMYPTRSVDMSLDHHIQPATYPISTTFTTNDADRLYPGPHTELADSDKD